MANIFNNVTNDSTMQSTNIPPLVVEIDDLCKLLNIGKNTAYKLLTTNQIESFKVGSVWKIPMYAINDYIRAQCAKPKRYLYTLIDPKKESKHKSKKEILPEEDLSNK